MQGNAQRMRTEGTIADAGHSAAFDPFDGVGKDEATEVKIKWWSDHVEQVLDSHRSPFVAAELLLQQMNEYGAEGNITEHLLLATVLPVLHRCAKVLGTHGELLEKALHELLPAIMFTRTYALSHREVLQRRSYAECFACILQKFNYHVQLSSTIQRKAALEEEVMTRAVRKLDRLWLKMCFRAWGGLCAHMQARKRGFQRLAARGAALRVVPGFLRSWRRYAHEVTLREKILKHDALTKEVEELFIVEQVAKSRHERILEEVREKNRSLETTTERCGETENRLKALEGILEETVNSLRAHWKSWNETTVNLFSDTNDFHPSVFGNLRSDLQSTVQNITDTAAFYLREARKRTCKVGKNTITQFISKAKLGGEIVERRGPDSLIAVVTGVCNPVTPPLRLVDVVREDQQKYDLTLKFLACINGGGHCSLFTQHRFNSEDDFPVDDRTEHGKEMVAHVATGVDSLHGCPESNEKYLQAMQNCLTAEELNQVHDYLDRVFCELAAAGLPLRRDKIEGCIESIVEPHDRQVVRALYPSQGIKSIADMVNYLLKLSQFTSWTISSLVEHLESNYDADPREDLFTAMYDESVVEYFHEHATALDGVFARFKEKKLRCFFQRN
ncbi:uncharacterized protein Tco025E_07860 [Trypanosoma conorhini]|uniref:Uncharacterized protein n=1 Tax=Trypanosoma conorhini TaxID=83891 RepID=A0A3R7KC36_9TRYP|nr:uncharacterized protein Tco025E_07860 [Trypanosoma conorhini]RNF05133.1 hypothetical protein Tco025E_07860 [Trypanosoma conorhini]